MEQVVRQTSVPHMRSVSADILISFISAALSSLLTSSLSLCFCLSLSLSLCLCLTLSLTHPHTHTHTHAHTHTPTHTHTHTRSLLLNEHLRVGNHKRPGQEK